MVKISKKKINLEIIKNAFEEYKKFNPQLKPFFLQDISSAVSTFMELDNSIPDYYKSQFVYKTICDLERKNKLELKYLNEEMNNHERLYLSRPTHKYILATTISIRSLNQSFIFRKGGTTLNIASQFPKKIKMNGLVFNEDIKRNITRSSSYSKLWITIDARNLREAYYLGMRKIDFFRGIWNYYLNWNRISRTTMSGQKTLINSIVLGPVQTLHRFNNGKPYMDYYYEPFFVKSHRTININSKLNKILEFQKKVRRRLKKSQYRAIIYDAIIKYCRALDLFDYEVAYIKLWNVLEILTDTIGGRYDQMIKRASFIYVDRCFHKQILEHLRNQRNHLIHKSKSLENDEASLFQLKRYVDDLLHFHIFCLFKFNDINEVGAFLEMSSKKDSLERRYKKIKYAIKYFKNE